MSVYVSVVNVDGGCYLPPLGSGPLLTNPGDQGPGSHCSHQSWGTKRDVFHPDISTDTRTSLHWVDIDTDILYLKSISYLYELCLLGSM